jgi:hypothetical protein
MKSVPRALSKWKGRDFVYKEMAGLPRQLSHFGLHKSKHANRAPSRDDPFELAPERLCPGPEA